MLAYLTEKKTIIHNLLVPFIQGKEKKINIAFAGKFPKEAS